MRDFEKISFKQFSKDVENNIDKYNNIKIPQRDSDATAGYDIRILNDIILKPNEISFKTGDSIVQGIFMKYLTTKSDETLKLERRSDY